MEDVSMFYNGENLSTNIRSKIVLLCNYDTKVGGKDVK